MTWTVENKNSVSAVGDVPPSVEGFYTNTYQKGQVRHGDVATLTLNGLGGMTILSAEVYVRSNKDSGAGRFTLALNGTEVYAVEGDMPALAGAYDNTESHPVTLLSEPVSGVHDAEITLTGTVSSLYIERYVITYSAAPVYAVTLMLGDNTEQVLKETNGGEGVVLPVMPDRDKWTFVGWTEEEFFTRENKPVLYTPGSVFFPHSDCTLWAVFKYAEADKGFVTELQSGDYIYSNRLSGYALTGVPSDGKMDYALANPCDAWQVYSIDLVPPDTAYITHKATGTPIGYSGTKLVDRPTPWLVYHEGDQTLFYMVSGTQRYVLWLLLQDANLSGHITFYYAGLQPVGDSMTSPMGLLLPQTEPDVTAYTCHPEFGLPVHTPQAQPHSDTTVRLGIFRLRITDGKKYLSL